MRELRRRHGNELVAQMLTAAGTVAWWRTEHSQGIVGNVLRTRSRMSCAETNPWRGVKVRDDDRRAVKKALESLRVWAFEDSHRFAAAAGRYEPMIRTLADCGLRIGNCSR